MKDKRFPLYEFTVIVAGELIASAIICAIFALMQKFTLAVALGAMLGSLVTVANFLILIITTNRAIDKVMSERGDAEMTDEEAAEFAAQHRASLQLASRLSYFARTGTMIAAIIVSAMLSSVFNVLATVIPLLMFSPLITISQVIKKKINKE